MNRTKLVRRLLIGLAIAIVVLYVLNGDLLVEKVYGNITFDADTLLVYRTGTDRGTMITRLHQRQK